MATTTPIIPIVTYDYTTASDKFDAFTIPSPPTLTGPPGFVEAIDAWAADPKSSTVAKLYEELRRVCGDRNQPGLNPSYVYLKCTIYNNNPTPAYNPTFELVFLKYPLRQKGYNLYSLYTKNPIGTTSSQVAIKFNKVDGKYVYYYFAGGGNVHQGVIDGQDYWNFGSQSPKQSIPGSWIVVLYSINGTFMTILDENGNPIEGFLGPPETELTISQFNDKLVYMYVEMVNRANEQWNQKLKMIEYHRQQMIASIEGTYSAQLAALQSAKEDNKRALLTARGEQIYNIESIRRSEIIRIDGQCDNEIKGVEVGKQTAREQYEQDCQKAYIEKCKRDNHDGQRLAARGKGGGYAESAKAGNVVTYQQRLNELLRVYNAEVDRINLEIDVIRLKYNVKRQEKEQEYALIISDITAQYNMMLLDADRKYDNQIADYESQKAESIFSINLDYDQMRDAETMYYRYYEKELQHYFEDLKIPVIEV